jgi:Cohesin domain/PEP-CTERM motif
MKRDLAMLVVLISGALLICWTPVADAASLTILPNPLVGASGDIVGTSIVYSAEGALVSALQFSLLYDPNSLLQNSATEGSAATAASKGITLVSNPGTANVAIFGLNQIVIGNGSVADFTFQLTPVGPYSLFLSGILGSDPNGNPVSITNLNPVAGVPEPAAVWLLGIGFGALAAWRRLRGI